jgi:hypothetical protein
MNITQGKAAAYDIYPQGAHLQDVVQALDQAGFQHEDICLLLAPTHPIAASVRDMRSIALEPRSSAALAELVGWLSKLGAVVISNIGLFIRSRAFLHAFLDTSETPAMCRNWGTLVSLGIPERDAGRLRNRINEDGGLIYVSCERTSQSEWAMEVLRKTGAHETSCLQ